MSHPAVARLCELLPPPVSGGDAVNWAEIERTTGLALPADYREFVETYGGGEIDEYLSVSTPPVPGSPYGDLLDGVDPALGCLEELGALLSTGALPPLLPFAYLGHGDVAFWLCEGAPDDWRVAVFQRQVAYGMNHWIVFEGGMASFCVAVLTGEVDSLGARLPAGSQHEFVSWRGV
ncbi:MULTISPECIES: SMI1/KNR4 family protein [Streptomyces]|uniref:SMI1/KNR4 family protein n=1 Tax=Streptomyces edwardsiae TaxID=3075527 RepID=A0ABU2PY92_9ACTN|nr:SMI1/KNR4 family protein [Streptomyces sp. DSM 41636]MDT0396260.1 SMI1/KNR4 family protein [Streptomyces sp. DSM 41636]